MAATTNQKSYLQKYLGGSSRDKKKKKKAVKGKGFQIIDDDIDLSKLRPLDGDELDVFDEGEDAPQIAGIIDDRPEELKQLDQLRTTSKWKIINQDDGFNSKLQIEEIKKDHKEAEKENELIFGKMYSDSEDEKNNVSISHEKNLKDTSKKHNSDSDFSPLRKKHGQPHKNRISNLENNDSDLTPPKRHSNYKQQSSDQKNNYNSEGDFSPPRRKEGQTHKQQKNSARSPSSHNKTKERVRKPSRWGTKEIPEETNYRDIVKSSSYKSRQDSDESPPRKSRRDYDSRHPSRRAQQTCNSDASPQRRSKKDNYNSYLESISPTKKQTNSPRHNYDHRNYHKNKYKTEKCTRRHSSDSDLSPPRKNKRKSVSPIQKSKKLLENNKRKYNNDSDQSPLRRDKVRDTYDRNKRSNDSPLPTNKKMARTLEGKMAGLQDARQLRHENNEFRRKEDEAYNKMSDEVSGRNAKAVSRKGKRETSEERQKQREKTQRQKELDIKYKKWSRGLKQIEDQEARVQEFIHEAAKPLARHRDDRDLEDKLKQLDRAGDPMLQYIKEKKRERGELAPEKPSYKGSFPPNRFNIRPGYRWDGVDRSNGYEKKFFEQQSKKKAQEEDFYKWSTEDL